jgi:hypothetical protein
MDASMNIPLSRSNPNHRRRGFVACYDRETGEYLNHGIIPAEERSYTGSSFVSINNHVLVQGRYAHPNWNANQLIAYFRDDGVFMGADTIWQATNPYSPVSREILINESGYLFTHFQGNGKPAIFGDITVSGGTWNSNACFGMMYNPSILTPYDTIDNIIPYSKDLRLYLYPNPTTDGMALFGELQGFKKIEIYDLAGRKLTETGSYTFDLSPYSSGVYLVKVHFANGETVTKKAVKQ